MTLKKKSLRFIQFLVKWFGFWILDWVFGHICNSDHTYLNLLNDFSFSEVQLFMFFTRCIYEAYTKWFFDTRWMAKYASISVAFKTATGIKKTFIFLLKGKLCLLSVNLSPLLFPCTDNVIFESPIFLISLALITKYTSIS